MAGSAVTVQLVREDPTGGEQCYAVFIDAKQSQSCVYAFTEGEALAIAVDAYAATGGDALAFMQRLDSPSRGKWRELRARNLSTIGMTLEDVEDFATAEAELWRSIHAERGTRREVTSVKLDDE